MKLGVIGRASGNLDSLSIGSHLLSYIDAPKIEKEFEGTQNYNLIHKVYTPNTIGEFDPFTVYQFSTKRNVIPIRILNNFQKYTWLAAVYIISRETPPIWYQVQLEINNEVMYLADSHQGLSCESEFLSISRIVSGRVVVGWKDFGRLDWR